VSGVTIDPTYYYTLTSMFRGSTFFLTADGSTANSFVQLTPSPTHLGQLFYELWLIAPVPQTTGLYTIQNMSSVNSLALDVDSGQPNDRRVRLTTLAALPNPSQIWQLQDPTNTPFPVFAGFTRLTAGSIPFGGKTFGSAVDLDVVNGGPQNDYAVASTPINDSGQYWKLDKSGVAA
jgi:hypothetical protein